MSFRVVTNTTTPFLDLGGTPILGRRVEFLLVDSTHSPIRAELAQTYSVADRLTATTDVNGVFSIALAPNEGLSPYTAYIVTTYDDNPTPFIAQIPIGTTPMAWEDLKQSGTPLSSDEMNLLSTHLSEANIPPIPNHLPDITGVTTGYVVTAGSGDTPVWAAPTGPPGSGLVAFEATTQPPVMAPGDIWIQTP